MKAIVYTTNTGNTEKYAKLLGNQIELPVYSLGDAKKILKKDTPIIYLGWIMASGIKGYKEAEKFFSIRMVCAVGMGATGTQLQEIRDKNQIPLSTEVFTLQGGFDMKKLRGVNRLMMCMMVKAAGKALAEKTDRTSEENDMLELMIHGGSRVSLENLSEPVKWYEQNRFRDQVLTDVKMDNETKAKIAEEAARNVAADLQKMLNPDEYLRIYRKKEQKMEAK